jgi:hypothetical protein
MIKKIGQYFIKVISWVPSVWLFILYVFTVLCWIELGHFPIPSLNDPKDIGFLPFHVASVVGLFLAFYSIALWLLLLPLSIKFTLLNKNYIILMSISSLISMIHFFIDPWNIIVWLLD